MDQNKREIEFNNFIRKSFNASPWNPVPGENILELPLFRQIVKQCVREGIHVGMIDIDDINAIAFDFNGAECIGITRGMIQQLHNASALLASCINKPFFQNELFWDDEKRLSATRYRKGRSETLSLSNEQHALFRAITDVSITFVFFHELGHLQSGHIHWLRDISKSNCAALFENPRDVKSDVNMTRISINCITALEIDADTDAVNAVLRLLDDPSLLATCVDNDLKKLLISADSRYPIIDLAFNTVFILFSHESEPMGIYNGPHPHPDVRSAYCVAGILAYCDQLASQESSRIFRRWRADVHLRAFYWELHYILKGPYHLKNFFENIEALNGKINDIIKELWSHSRPIWEIVQDHALERQRKIYMLRS